MSHIMFPMKSESEPDKKHYTQITERVFYDGHCGLCHFSVRFVLLRDQVGHFRFAPLDSEIFRAAVPEAARAGLPDSVIVQTASGELLVRSTAIIYLAKRLGGIWQILGTMAELIPVSWRDRLYDWIAGIRHHLFAPPAAACPLIPPHLRDRFDY